MRCFFCLENCIAYYGYLSQDMTVAVSSPREPESEEKPLKSVNGKQQVYFLFYFLLNDNKLGFIVHYYYLYDFPF